MQVSLMDKTWINLRSRASEEYIRGVTSFLNFAFERTEDGKIWCPCVNCVNTYRVSAFDHLICDGFLKGYVRWIFHGERCDGSTQPVPTNVEEREFEHDIHNLLHDMMAERVMNNDERNNHSVDPSTRLENHNHRLQGDKFYALLKDAEDERQPGWLTFKHAKLRDVFDMGDTSSFDKDEEPEQLILDDSIDTGFSSWIRNDVGVDGLDVTPDMENENTEEDPIN
ncbi:hypothetical protein V6N13_108622 [Hibiscus sabdariffa]|uniref:Transposase-associated domain-containing protein n=1 Tax=Hibiscus sabdariffa TaxID=183260 RepID=A0ABR2STK4_9ROSI